MMVDNPLPNIFAGNEMAMSLHYLQFLKKSLCFDEQYEDVHYLSKNGHLDEELELVVASLHHAKDVIGCVGYEPQAIHLNQHQS